MKSSTEMTLLELAAVLRTRTVQDESFREMAIELNKKLSIPFSCFVFALVGLPLGMRAHRSVRSRGFAVGLVLVLVFYVLRLAGEALVETGRISAIIGTWTPNALFLIAGTIQFSLAAKERRLFKRRGPASPAGNSSRVADTSPLSPADRASRAVDCGTGSPRPTAAQRPLPEEKGGAGLRS